MVVERDLSPQVYPGCSEANRVPHKKTRGSIPQGQRGQRSMSLIPFIAMWDGEYFVPMRRFMRAIDKKAVIGAWYRLVEENERSMKSHSHFFACVTEAWKQ